MANEDLEPIYVNYEIDGVGYQTGPYKTVDEAHDNLRDIRGYDRVTVVFLSQERDERRMLVGGVNER